MQGLGHPRTLIQGHHHPRLPARGNTILWCFPFHPALLHTHLLLYNRDNRSSCQVGLQRHQVLGSVLSPVAAVDGVCPGLSGGDKHLCCTGTQKKL